MNFIDLIGIAAAIIALIIAIVGHEFMHGWVAYRFGDTTAKDAGRLTLNPISHIDPVGTLLVPAMMYFVPMLLGMGGGMLFGWAKPVPVDMRTVTNGGGYRAAMEVSLAGIAFNLFAATLFSVFLSGMQSPEAVGTAEYTFLYVLVVQSVIINVLLAVLNLLPIPQLDGAKFLTFLSLQMRWRQFASWLIRMEPYGLIIVLVMLMTPLKDYFLIAPVKFILSILV